MNLPIAERSATIRKLRFLDRSTAVDTLEELLSNSLDANSRTTAIKLLGKVGGIANVETLLGFYETHRSAVTKALVGVGVFDDIMPSGHRERKGVQRALNHATPELVDLIREGRLTRESLHSILPSIM